MNRRSFLSGAAALAVTTAIPVACATPVWLGIDAAAAAADATVIGLVRASSLTPGQAAVIGNALADELILHRAIARASRLLAGIRCAPDRSSSNLPPDRRVWLPQIELPRPALSFVTAGEELGAQEWTIKPVADSDEAFKRFMAEIVKPRALEPA